MPRRADSDVTISPYSEPVQPLFTTDVLGPVELVTAPTGVQILTNAEAKLACRIDSDDTSQDSVIDDLIDSATDFCEQGIWGHRQFRQATYDVRARWFWCGELYLPRPPLFSVGSAKHYDADEVLTTISSSDYLVRTPWKQPGAIALAPDATWPTSMSTREWPIVIRFTAGFATAAAVPKTIKQAIRFLVVEWFSNRMPVGQDPTGTVQSLLNLQGWGSYA